MELHLAIDENAPLTRQIYDQIRDAIVDGRLRDGTRIPSSRDLATSLGVARNTVAAAFDHLLAEGYLHARVGVGTYVDGDAGRASPRRRHLTTPLTPTSLWRREVPQIPDLLGEHPGYDFRCGIPDDSLFPYPTWRRMVDASIRRSSRGAVYADPAGPVALREAIARHVAVSRGLQVGPDDLIVTNGVQQAVSLLGQVLVAPGDVVAVEEPGYPLVRRAFESARAQIVGVPVDENGIVVERLPHRARLAFVTPAHQFPLGVRMSLERRIALLDWADQANAAIIEDDYDTDFRYTGRPLDPLHVLDRAERVIYVGSFSKTMLPTLRIGYCIAPAPIRQALRRARFTADWHGCLTTQLALASFINEGTLAAHVRRMRRVYEQRCTRIAMILDRDFDTDLQRIPTSAGMHLSAWSRTATSRTVAAWAADAAEADVAVHTIADFAVEPARPGLIFGFGAVPLDRIDEGLRRLRTVLWA